MYHWHHWPAFYFLLFFLAMLLSVLLNLFPSNNAVYLRFPLTVSWWHDLGRIKSDLAFLSCYALAKQTIQFDPVQSNQDSTEQTRPTTVSRINTIE
jgi:hypothetical protein